MNLINKVPPEILLEIFSFSAFEFEYGIASHTEPPWTLAQVCGRWRRLAIAAHELWSSIELNTQSMNASYFNMLTTWFNRSGNHPLDIKLAMFPPWRYG